jgi:hypothetical protein
VLYDVLQLPTSPKRAADTVAAVQRRNQHTAFADEILHDRERLFGDVDQVLAKLATARVPGRHTSLSTD